MKHILEYLLGRGTKFKTSIGTLSADIERHENDILDIKYYESYKNFLRWLTTAMKEYGDLTEEEYNFFKPNDKHFKFYTDGSIRFRPDEDTENVIYPKFSIMNKKISYIEAYQLIIDFCLENVDKIH